MYSRPLQSAPNLSQWSHLFLYPSTPLPAPQSTHLWTHYMHTDTLGYTFFILLHLSYFSFVWRLFRMPFPFGFSVKLFNEIFLYPPMLSVMHPWHRTLLEQPSTLLCDHWCIFYVLYGLQIHWDTFYSPWFLHIFWKLKNFLGWMNVLQNGFLLQKQWSEVRNMTFRIFNPSSHSLAEWPSPPQGAGWEGGVRGSLHCSLGGVRVGLGGMGPRVLLPSL